MLRYVAIKIFRNWGFFETKKSNPRRGTEQIYHRAKLRGRTWSFETSIDFCNLEWNQEKINIEIN